MNGSIRPVTILPRATPRTGPAVRFWGWGIVWSGPVPGVGQIKNHFSLILQSTCYFSRGLHEVAKLKTTYFRSKIHEFVGVVGEKEPIKIRVCIWRYVLKIQTNVHVRKVMYGAYSNGGSFCNRNEIFLQSNSIITQLMSSLPISISHRLFRCRYSNSRVVVASSLSFSRPPACIGNV